MIYYVGPVDPVGEEVVGPAGPTTATRMDKFTDMMLEQGLLAMVGKAERGLDTVASIKKHKSAYLMAVGGSAYLVSRAIKGSKVVGFEDLGMEAIYEFEVQDMPVTVAVDAEGQSVHHLAPLVWQEKIKQGRAAGKRLSVRPAAPSSDGETSISGLPVWNNLLPLCCAAAAGQKPVVLTCMNFGLLRGWDASCLTG